ncbi:MAG: DNA topology modulation protein [Pyrinomonadaceae bacterium]
MRKVLVLGSGGAGKSTFAGRLGQMLDIEVMHLDAFYWNPGWVETPRDEWRKTLTEMLSRDCWIMDGNYSNTLDLRLEACDTIIFLDLARPLCLWRVVKRQLMNRRRRRPDMAEGCNERFSLEFLLWVWNYPNTARPKIIKGLAKHAQSKRVVWLRSRAEVENFLTGIRAD